MSERDDDRQVRVEEDRPRDPEKPDVTPTYGVGSKLDDAAERAARAYTAGRPHEPTGDDEGRSLSRRVPHTPETGRGVDVTLDGDAEQTVAPGDEIWIHLPAAGRRGWTYDVEAGESVVDVEERSEILQGTEHRPPPDSTGFIVRAEQRGEARVRFEPVEEGLDVAPRRLRVTVR